MWNKKILFQCHLTLIVKTLDLQEKEHLGFSVSKKSCFFLNHTKNTIAAKL